MTCPSCEHHVERALRETGAREVEANFRRGEALLTMDAPPDVAALSAAVRHAGYTAGAIEPLAAAKAEADNLVDYRLPVEGMTCADSERHVADALRGAGATLAEANFRRGEARFRAPDTIEPSRFVTAAWRGPSWRATLWPPHTTWCAWHAWWANQSPPEVRIGPGDPRYALSDSITTTPAPHSVR
jgi:copper chaperone CopZ